jgi:hypoxanthine-guanine phosphoribosyltransferase
VLGNAPHCQGRHHSVSTNAQYNRKNQLFSSQRLSELNQNLRLAHLKEGEEDIRRLCEEYADIFKLKGDKLTATNAAMHHIPTPHFPKGRAITLKNYRIAETHKEEVDRQVKQMLADGIVIPSKSEWNFPLIVVPKKLEASGTRKWRLCVDFRKLNDITIGDSFPLPNIQEILDKVGKAKYFTALDCASGFHQIPIAPEDKCKTAFSTPTGHFEYARMPFGLKAAPATFQRMMNSILSESMGERSLVYMDDVLVTGRTLEEHNENLKEVFEQFRKYSIKLEPDKCEFLKRELTYLGHVITAEGVQPDPKKVEAVVRFPAPENERDVKAFLGLVGYYRKFIEQFSALAKPLTDLLRKEKLWQWTEMEQESFENLKEKLTKFPVLQYPDFMQPFLLTTDASGYALGAVLSQGTVGKDKPIAYASRALNEAETRYSTVEKECLAIVWACKHFRPYLLGRRFQIWTDHKGLTWIFNVKDPSSRLLRWRLLLEEYDFEIKYKPGKQNTNADSLSRYPIGALEQTEISEERKQRIMKEMHSDAIGGHQGISRTLERIKLYLTWPGMQDDVIQFINKCEICQKVKHNKQIKLKLRVTDTQPEPWKKIYLDIVGPLPVSEEGHKFILTCQDNLSKYLIAVPLHDQTAEEVSEKLLEHVLLIYGIPQAIVTDQGSNFMSDVFKRLCQLFQIEKLHTSVYHPESNGALERTHKTLVAYLRSYVDKQQMLWNQWLPFACFCFNTTPHSITKYSPYEMLFGRKCNLPGELGERGPLYNYDDIVQVIKHRMRESHHIARQNLQKFKERQRERVPEKNVSKIQVNDLVLVQKKPRHNKLDALWEGPYEVKELRLPNLVLQRIGKRKTCILHMNLVKPFCSQDKGNEDNSFADCRD